MNQDQRTTYSNLLGANQFQQIFNAICDENNQITKHVILSILEKSGIGKDDLRIKNLLKRLEHFGDEETIDVAKFEEITTHHIILLEKAVTKSFVIPNFDVFKAEIEAIYHEVLKNNSGKNANYIPQLASVNPDLFAVAFCSIDGQMITLGDTQEKFCAQSTSKPISYCIASDLHGEQKLHQHVGREPSGGTFNAITLNKNQLPHNPMINAGAIVTCSLIKPELDALNRLGYVSNIWADLGGGEKVGFDEAVYQSEKGTANRNYALAYFMKEVGAVPEDANIEDILNFYFQCCSIQIDARQAARIMSSFANGGICPLTNKRVFSSNTIKNCLSIMYSCGMYDFSGEYAFKVGLPAKSGVSGALMIVIPNVGSFALFSPRLDDKHNSAKGVEFSERLVEKFSFHNYDHLDSSAKINPTKNSAVTEFNLTQSFIYAASQGDLDEVKRFIALGVEVNKGDYDNRTALHLAAAEGKYHIVKYLIDKGANNKAVDRWGQTPMDDAKRSLCAKTMEKMKVEL